VSTVNAPAARSYHTAVWTGSEMIVWGGQPQLHEPGTGGCYNPVTKNWTEVNITDTPSGRLGHTSVWTGSQMIVWGGCDGWDTSKAYNDGGLYDPSSNSWTALSTPADYAGRVFHTAVWTGKEMIVWNGTTKDWLHRIPGGYRYDLSKNTWTTVTNDTTGSRNHTAIWTGNEMIIWGGEYRSNNILMFTPVRSLYLYQKP